MPDPDDIREAPSIAPAFSECLGLYRHLYLSLTGSDPRVVDQVDVPKVCDNYGRLNVWGSDSGALRTGRGSLDDVLRTNENLRSIVLDTISDLTKSLKRATLLADAGINEEHLLAGDSDEDSLSSASTTSESFADGGSRSRSKKGEIHFAFCDIFVHIQSLYKISVSLRRPAVHDKYIRSVSKDANASYFIPWDHTHVESKFRNASEVLVRRLALANTRRRQQLKYWEMHPQDAAEGVLSEAALSDTATPQKKLAMGRPATESNPTQSLGIPSRATKQSFSTVALSVINDHETFSGRPKTLYEPSLQGAGGYLRVPDRPTVPFGRTSFECPYCRTQLDVQTMRKRQLWKKHVFRDLRPYVCTYEGCLNAEKLYVTRHDWMYHEGQLHQRSWICGNQCNCKFPSPQLLKEHMLDCHLGTFAESQLPILIDMCERPADPDERASCPLCGVETSLKALRTHVASHLEDIALFVLPVETDDHDTDADSHHTERPRDKDNRLDDDELSSIGSLGEDEDVQGPLQDPKAFETALKKEREYSLPEVGDWLDIGQEVRSEEEKRRDTFQADLDADAEANRRRKFESLVLFCESRTDVLIPYIQALVSSIRTSTEPSDILDHLAAIVSVTSQIVAKTHDASPSEQSVQKLVLTLSECVDRLEDKGREGEAIDDDRDWGIYVKSLPPLAFEIGRSAEELRTWVEEKRDKSNVNVIADARECQRQIESIGEEPETIESTSPDESVTYREYETPFWDQGELAEVEDMPRRALKGKRRKRNLNSHNKPGKISAISSLDNM